MPTITVEFSKGKSVARVRCLVDTGSQRSYISSSVIQRLNILDCTYDKKILVNTFANSKFKEFSEMCMSISFVNGSTGYSLPILVDRQFSLNFEINGLADAICNVKRRFNLADSFFNRDIVEEVVELEGIIGIDSLQLFNSLGLRSNRKINSFLLEMWTISFLNLS